MNIVRLVLHLPKVLWFWLRTSKAQRKQLYTEQLLEDMQAPMAVDDVKASLRLGAALDATDACGRSLMDLAMSRQSAEVVQLLIDHGYDIHAVPDGSQRILSEAVVYQDLNFIQSLIDQGCQVNVATEWGALPLIRAIYCLLADDDEDEDEHEDEDERWGGDDHARRKHYRAVIELLMRNGADINVRFWHGGTLLHMQDYDNLNVLQLALELGADPNIQYDDGNTGLQELNFHLSLGDKKLLAPTRLYLEHGCDLNLRNRYGRTFLHQLCYHGKAVEVIKQVLAHGADVHLRDGSGKTALDYVMPVTGNDREDIRDLLIEAGCRPTSTEADRKLHQATTVERFPVAETLVRDGANVNITDEENRTPLYDCATFDNQALARLLLQYGADTEVRTYGGATALFEAVVYNHVALARILLEHGAEVNARREGDQATALHLVDSVAMAELLLAHGADIDAKDEKGKTPVLTTVNNLALTQWFLAHGADTQARDEDGNGLLYAAARLGNAAAVEDLLQGGVDVNQVNDEGTAALHVAAKFGHLATVETLLRHGAAVDILDHDQVTPLCEAVKFRRSKEKIAQHFCADDRPFSFVDEDGTPLCDDERIGAFRQIEALLIDHGAGRDYAYSEDNPALARGNIDY